MTKCRKDMHNLSRFLVVTAVEKKAHIKIRRASVMVFKNEIKNTIYGLIKNAKCIFSGLLNDSNPFLIIIY